MAQRFLTVMSAALLASALASGTAMAEIAAGPTAAPVVVSPLVGTVRGGPAPEAIRAARSCIKRDRTCAYSTQCCAGLVCVDHGSKGLVCAPGRSRLSRESLPSGLTRGWDPVRRQGHAPTYEPTALLRRASIGE
jgi:hypothetical protein